jgi:hypothetical protein
LVGHSSRLKIYHFMLPAFRDFAEKYAAILIVLLLQVTWHFSFTASIFSVLYSWNFNYYMMWRGSFLAISTCGPK